MEALSSLIKVSLANYIQNLPIPDSFFGILSLSSMYLIFNKFTINLFAVCLQICTKLSVVVHIKALSCPSYFSDYIFYS